MGVCQSPASHVKEPQLLQHTPAGCYKQSNHSSKLSLQNICPLVYIPTTDIDRGLRVSIDNQRRETTHRLVVVSESRRNRESRATQTPTIAVSVQRIDTTGVSVPTGLIPHPPTHQFPPKQQGMTTFILLDGSIRKKVPLLDLPSQSSSLLARRRLIQGKA